MFVILKDERTVIAADKAFLDKAGFQSIYLLAERFRVGAFPLDTQSDTLEIDGTKASYTQTPVQTLLGEAYRYDFEDSAFVTPGPLSESETDDETAPSKEADTEEALSVVEETEETAQPEESVEPKPDTPTDGEAVILSGAAAAGTILSLQDSEKTEAEAPEAEEAEHAETEALYDLIKLEEEEPSPAPDAEKEPEVQASAPAPEEEPELFDLIDLKEPEAHPASEESAATEPTADTVVPPLPETEEHPTHSEQAPADEAEPAPAPETGMPHAPFADYRQNAQLIGIGFEDYTAFLSQFLTESREKEPAMRSNDLRHFREGLSTLKDASGLLHLPKLSAKLHEMEEATSEEKGVLVDGFYAMIAQIQDDVQALAEEEKELPPSGKPEAPQQQESTPYSGAETEAPGEEGLDILEQTPPLPFDFSANVAAEELGLPEPLVEEFVVDFIQQAKENIPLFQAARKNGELETIQKTAHLLKGAASNLRIDPLAETLKDLQYNEEMNKVDGLFHRFVGQLKALENFLKTPGIK